MDQQCKRYSLTIAYMDYRQLLMHLTMITLGTTQCTKHKSDNPANESSVQIVEMQTISCRIVFRSNVPLHSDATRYN